MTNVEGVLDKDKKLIEEITSSEIALEMIKDEDYHWRNDTKN